jgi:hypothetical protein
MLRPVALVRKDVSEELGASIFRVTKIGGELETTLAVTRNGGAKFLRNLGYYKSHAA